MDEFLQRIEKMKFTTREYTLIAISLFLLGILLGIFLSPKGKRLYGSYNGSYNGISDACGEECEED